MKLLASLLTAAVVAAPAFSAAAADLAKGQETYGGVCIACHGEAGKSVLQENPVLAQQHPEYLVKQLSEYKSGKRNNAIMLGMAAMLSDEDMKNVSAYLAQQKADPGAATDKDLVALGEKIYRGGIQDRNIASCAGCHSSHGPGTPAPYPRLSGQHAQYIVTQLNQFRDGTRDNNQQMTDVAAKLNDKEIKALGEYIAGLK